MNQATIEKAQQFVRHGDVRLLKDSNPPGFFHFHVDQDSGQTADVYLVRDRNLGDKWSCNALGHKKNKIPWGCMLNICNRNKPFCSHTLACEIYLERFQDEYKEN